jgi:hypothetical protein
MFVESWVYLQFLNTLLQLRMLTYGVVAGVSDEYCKLGEVTAMGALKKFYKVVKNFFK